MNMSLSKVRLTEKIYSNSTCIDIPSKCRPDATLARRHPSIHLSQTVLMGSIFSLFFFFFLWMGERERISPLK
jgi:hypothetical protein